MEEEKTPLCYSLGEGLKGCKDSVSVRHYIARMKSAGIFRDADLWEAMAKEVGRDADYIRYLEGVRRKAIRDALKKVVPERLDAPSASFEIAVVVTSSLGKKGYNAVRIGEAFAVSGRMLKKCPGQFVYLWVIGQ